MVNGIKSDDISKFIYLYSRVRLLSHNALSLKYLGFLLVLLCFSTEIVSQSINTDFGKNRVQYHDDFKYWNRYETQNFITYWYGKARNIAEPVIQMAELDHDDIQNVMEHRTNNKIEIIVYTDVSDLKQSNIGLEEIFYSNSGETKIVGNKMFVYFDGNHNNLRQQIREGIASVYLNSMLFGDDFQEMVQNAVLLDLPEWYKKGIISYNGSYWDHLKDDELRDIFFKDEKYKNFEKLSEDFPKIAGHSMWFFIDQTYGKSTISNLLYITRITRSIENALLYVLNIDFQQLQTQWLRYYEQHYSDEEGNFTDDSGSLLNLANKPEVPVSTFKISPDGSKLVYAYNKIGKYRIVIQDLKSGERKTVFKYGHKNALQETDFNYPLVAWHPNSKEISFIYEHKDVIKLQKYSLETEEYEEQIIPTSFQRIYSFDYLDEFDYIFSANTNGYSDLYKYRSKSRQFEAITEDFYDDLDAQVVILDGVKGILFSSNRKRDHIFKIEYDTILPDGQFDIFFYDLERDDKSVKRITKTDEVSERYPYLTGNNKIVYLSSASGITNRYVISPVSASSYFSVSNKSRNIIRHHSIPASNLHAFTYYYDGKYNVYMDTVDWNAPVIPYTTRFENREVIVNTKDVFIPYAPEVLDSQKTTLSSDVKFQSEFSDPEKLEPINDRTNRNTIRKPNSVILIEPETEEEKEVIQFNSAQASAARLKFRLDNFTTKLDNDILFEGLESYTGNSDELLTNPMGFLFRANIKDLFEDYSIVAGARFPLTFDGSEYFITYENRKKLIDKRIALYRNTQTQTINDNRFPVWRAKKVSTLGLMQWKYPFTIYRSVRLTTSLRHDQFFSKATDEENFYVPISTEDRLSLKLEYVYDNTIDIATNIKHGTRYKIFAEAINEFVFDIVDDVNIDPSNGFTTILGFDARHYIPVLEHSVFAIRAAGATSFGSKRNLYYLGGVNNALSINFDNNIEIPSGNFAYKTNIHHLRGFSSNIRNGTSYTLINSELRMPVFRYFMNKYGGSNFLRNFQLVAFYDIGTAWHGASPYSDENPLNTVTVSSPPVIDLTIKYYRDPLVMGYGLGARMKLFGYYFRFDYARGVETRIVQDGRWHFSIGYDF